MIKLPYPWPTPPPAGPQTAGSSGYRRQNYLCHNCGNEEKILNVGGWLTDDYASRYDKNKLVLCRICFDKLSERILDKDIIKPLLTRVKILFTGRVR